MIKRLFALIGLITFIMLASAAIAGHCSNLQLDASDDALLDKIHGCLLGKCVGLVLGQPVEGWTKDAIEEKAREANCYPVEYYFPADFNSPMKNFLFGAFDTYPPNDDTDLMTVSFLTLREHGLDFTPRQLAENWLEHVGGACTAEGIALANFRKDIWPPVSADTDNPYAQWIGAQMRAEIWGMVAPGLPEQAAEFAYRDASTTHIRNGIYGEQYMAALVSLAMKSDNINAIIEDALKVIPENCEYAIAIRDVIAWHKSGYDWRKSWQLLDDHYGYNDDGTRNGKFADERFNTGEGLYQWGNWRWVHVTPNGAACVLALLYGEGDFSKTICIATMCGYDADCNAGTVGGVIGAIIGESKIPARWKDPLNDTFETNLMNTNDKVMKISDMAKELLGHAKTVLNTNKRVCSKK